MSTERPRPFARRVAAAVPLAALGLAVTVAGGTGAAAATTQPEPAAKAAGCNGAAFGPPGAWGPVSTLRCSSIAGSPGYRATYRWYVLPASSSQACVEGRGFDANGRAHWYSLGCGRGNQASVPWGNILANPQIRARSISVPLGAPIRFTA